MLETNREGPIHGPAKVWKGVSNEVSFPCTCKHHTHRKIRATDYSSLTHTARAKTQSHPKTGHSAEQDGDSFLPT